MEAGKRLYQQGCSSCHGLNVAGGPQAPSLIGVGGAAVDFQVSSGRMPLKAFGVQAARGPSAYTQPEIDQLVAYITSLAPGGPGQAPADYSATVAQLGDQVLGGELFRGNCASCHNFDGAGGALSNGLYAPPLHPASDRQILEAVRSGPESMPVFGPNQFSEKDVASIVQYVNFLNAPKDPGGHPIGHLGPVPEGLIAWLVGIGGLILITLWIGVRQ